MNGRSIRKPPGAHDSAARGGRVRELAVHDRPREKLTARGADALGDNELLAVVIGHGAAGRDALALSSHVLEDAGGIARLPRLSASQLARIRGLGPAGAARVAAAVELGRRTLLRAACSERQSFASPEALAAFLLPQFGGRTVEHFGTVLLDTRLRFMKTTIVSVGGLDASVVQPREVFREAVVSLASAIVLFHNHPSGDPAPSQADADLTGRLVDAGDLLGIRVLDHLVLGADRFFSFRATAGPSLRGRAASFR